VAGEPRGHRLRAAIDLAVGDTVDGVAGGSQTLVSFVVLVLGAGAGVASAVDLDDQVPLRPVEVDLEVFEVVAAVGPADGGADGALVEELAERGLVDHVRELVRGQHVAEVHKCARHRGDRDPVADSHVATVQASIRAHAHARQVSLARRQHVNLRDWAAPEPHMNCGIEGGKEGTRAARQDRRHPLALLREPWLPDRVHNLVPAVQASASRSPGDPRVPEPGTHELGGRDHPVLATGDRCDQGLQGGG
jgi:hypothetical protein